MSISTQITRLKEAKLAIKQAINDKGVEVAEDATLDAYPEYIGEISGGGGSDEEFIKAIEGKGETLTLPNGVLEIADYKFNRAAFKTINLPSTLKTIGNTAFSSCTSLTSIEIPDSVTSIGSSSFYNCTSLTSINIPVSVTSIGNNVFYSCSSLTSATIGNSVTSIGDKAFASCTSLTSATIGNSVTSIGNNAFHNCRILTSITYNGTIAQWKAISKGSDWHTSVPATSVTCTDGTTTLD